MGTSPQSQSTVRRYRQSPFHKPLRRVPGEGPVPSSIILIGEKPGIEEAQSGRPFVGVSGKYMDTFLAAANIDRHSVFVTNCVMEHTEYSKPTRAEMDRDHDELVSEILSCNPEIIGLVGAYAVEELLRRKPEMEKVHGVPLRVPSLFGGELTRDSGWLCLPILHPAGAFHSPETAGRILDDFLQLGRLRDHEITVREDEFPDPDYRVVHSGMPLPRSNIVAIDTEGFVRRPWAAQYSINPGTGYVIKHGDIDAVREFSDWLSNPNILVIGHNLLHDFSVSRSIGIELEPSRCRDTMILAYLLGIEPQGLKALSFRHLGMEQDEYADIMYEASRDRAMEYLYSVLEKQWPEVEPFIVYEKGMPRVKKPWDIDRRVAKIIEDVIDGKVDKEGNPTDPRKRWREIDDFVRDPVENVLGPMTEATLDDIDPDTAIRYAARDADCTRRLYPVLWQKVKDMGLERISKIDHDVLPMLDQMQTVGIKLAGKEFWDDLEIQCEEQENKARWAIYQETGWDLNPMSGDQVAALLYSPTREQLIRNGIHPGDIQAAGLGLIPPKMTDGGKSGKVRGSTNDKCLENLLPQSPVVEHIMDYRSANKLIGTYIGPLRQLAVAGDGRAHPGIKPTRVSSGRLATADPNLLAIPVHWGLGTKVRGGFVADDGCVLYDADLSQAEMRCMAHDSRDEKLCRVFWDKQDIHTMTACEMFSEKPDYIEDWQRYAAKQCIAEGQLVLTDSGLIPIEKITLQHKLWDGVEWVDHEGLIDHGIRGVIEYDGLTATPDHKVYTEIEEGIIARRPFGEIASSLGRLHCTGIDGQAIRTYCRDLPEGETQERLRRDQMQMRGLWAGNLETEIQPAQAQLHWTLQILLRLHQIRQAVSRTAGGALRRHLSTLQQPELSGVRGLWCPWNPLPVQVPIPIREMGGEKFAAQGLYRDHYRPYRQRWALQTGKSAVGHNQTAEFQSAKHSLRFVSWGTDESERIRQSLPKFMDLEADSREGHDRGTNHTTGSLRLCSQSAEKDTDACRRVDKTSRRVYDILNAGPRHRFTVSGRLVANCGFGIINLISEYGLYDQMILYRAHKPDGSRWSLDECAGLLETWFGIYKGVRRYHNAVIQEARETGLSRESIGGRIRYVPGVWSPVGKIRGDSEREACSHRIQSMAQSYMKLAMAIMWEYLRVIPGVSVLLQIHDEILIQCPDDNDTKSTVDQIVTWAMESAYKLRVPMGADGGFGQNWIEAKG